MLTISARIAELEFTLGMKLFDRVRQRAELTLRGRDILSSVERMWKISDEISQQQSDPSTLRGLLRLGAVESVAFFTLPILLPRLRAAGRATDHADRLLRPVALVSAADRHDRHGAARERPAGVGSIGDR